MTRTQLHATLASALVATSVLALAYPGAATPRTSGCWVNVKLQNTEPSAPVGEVITVHLYYSRVKIKYGIWKPLENFNDPDAYVKVAPGKTKTRTVRLTFGCGVKRRYKFLIEEADHDTRTVYFPGPNSWTERQSFKVDLHIVG